MTYLIITDDVNKAKSNWITKSYFVLTKYDETISDIIETVDHSISEIKRIVRNIADDVSIVCNVKNPVYNAMMAVGLKSANFDRMPLSYNTYSYGTSITYNTTTHYGDDRYPHTEVYLLYGDDFDITRLIAI